VMGHRISCTPFGMYHCHRLLLSFIDADAWRESGCDYYKTQFEPDFNPIIQKKPAHGSILEDIDMESLITAVASECDCLICTFIWACTGQIWCSVTGLGIIVSHVDCGFGCDYHHDSSVEAQVTASLAFIAN
jgi:hypothetical protein